MPTRSRPLARGPSDCRCQCHAMRAAAAAAIAALPPQCRQPKPFPSLTGAALHATAPQPQLRLFDPTLSEHTDGIESLILTSSFGHLVARRSADMRFDTQEGLM